MGYCYFEMENQDVPRRCRRFTRQFMCSVEHAKNAVKPHQGAAHVQQGHTPVADIGGAAVLLSATVESVATISHCILSLAK